MDKISVGIYTRVSSSIQVDEGFSLEAQEKAGIKYCDYNKLQYRVFAEKGKSANSETIENRKVLQELLKEIGDRKIQAVFVTEIDRLSRNPASLWYIKEKLKDNDVKLHTPGRVYNFKDDQDDLTSEISGAIAKYENRLRVTRSIRGKEQAAQKGKWVSSIRPYGWTALDCKEDRDNHHKLVPHPDEKVVYLKMVDLCLSGKGTNAIARELNAMGVPTRATTAYKQGKKFKWKAGTIFRILKSPLYKGDYVYKGVTTKIAGIISEEQWELLQKQLQRNYNNASRNTKRFYLLKGLLYCKKCGRRLFGLIKPSRGMRCYCCISKRADPDPRFCGMKNIHLDKINKLVWHRIRELVLDSEKLKQAINLTKQSYSAGNILSETFLSSLDRRINEKRKQIENLVDLYSKTKALTTEELDKKINSMKEEIKKLTEEKEEVLKERTRQEEIKQNMLKLDQFVSIVKNRIDNFTDQEEYDFLHLVIDKIIVDYDCNNLTHSIEIIGGIPLINEDKELLREGQLQQASGYSFNRRRNISEARRGKPCA